MRRRRKLSIRVLTRLIFFMSKAIGLLLIVTMLSHLFFKTGIMAILVVGVMYLVLVGKYSCSCVSLRKDRILRS